MYNRWLPGSQNGNPGQELPMPGCELEEAAAGGGLLQQTRDGTAVDQRRGAGAGKEASFGEVSMELTGRTGLACLGVLWQRESGTLPASRGDGTWGPA
jgi:hypothetical protein